MVKKRYSYIDFLAVIACFAVVTLHTSAAPGNENVNVTTLSFSSVMVVLINILFAFAVPIFFMQSGANVLNYRERYSTKVFVKKRIDKVVIPFVVWSILGYLLIVKAPFNHVWLLNLIKGFINGTIVGPYWFFYNIIGFYLCVPILSLIIDKSNLRIIKYFIILTVIFNTVLPMLLQLAMQNNNMIVNSVPIIGNYLEYFITGWYVAHVDISKKTIKRVYLLGIIMLIFEILITLYTTFNMSHGLPYFGYAFDNIVKTFYDISNFPAFCYVTALFLFFKNHEHFFVDHNWNKWLPKLSSLTFGIYLTHPFFVAHVLPKMVDATNNWNFIGRIILYPVVIFILSAISTVILRKIPVLKKIVP